MFLLLLLLNNGTGSSGRKKKQIKTIYLLQIKIEQKLSKLQRKKIKLLSMKSDMAKIQRKITEFT